MHILITIILLTPVALAILAFCTIRKAVKNDHH